MNNLDSIIERAIMNHESEVKLLTHATDNEVYLSVRNIMRNNPDIFWFSHQWSYSQDNATVSFRFTIDKERCEKIARQIDDVVRNDFKLDNVRTLSVREQVMYVYKWIALYCNYDIHSAHNQTIYSVFVLRHSVCTGIAKAAQYLLKLLGIESRLVFGKMNNSEKDSRHCWLIVHVEGRWYHLDPTFALPETEQLIQQCEVKPLQGDDFLFYNFFCVDTAVIKQSRTIEEEELLPLCNDRIDYTLLQQINVTPSRHGETAGLGCLLSDVGTTADIYLAHSAEKYGRRRTVAKVFKDDPDHELMRKELIVMRECAGPHLLRAQNADFDKGIIYMEQAIPLSELLSSHYYKLTLKGFCNLLIDIASGLQELLNHGILYRDIHLNNIYLWTDPIFGSTIYKLGDFGSCSFVDEYGKYAGLTERGGVGSKWYMAPETWNKGIFDERSSVYGVGMIAYYLLNDLYPPFWKSHKFDCADIRYGGHEIDDLNLKFIYNPIIINSLHVVIERAMSFCVQYRYQNLKELILDIDRLVQVIGNEDYSIPFTNTNVDFSHTRICSCIHTTASNNFVEAEIECLNCGCHFEISVLQELIDQMLPALPTENAYGSLSLCIKAETDTIPCPQCGYKNTLKDSVKHDKLNILPLEHKEFASKIDDFATTCIPNISSDSLPHESNGQRTDAGETFFPRSRKGLYAKIRSLLYGKSRNQVNANQDDFNSLAEKVNSSIFAPSEAKRGDYMLVQVFLYKDGEERFVAGKASEVDPNARRQNYTPLSVKLKDGDRVKATLNMVGKGIEVIETVQEMAWQGYFTDCQFGVFVPEDYKPSTVMGTVLLSVNAIPRGRMMFMTKIVIQPQQLHAKIDCKTFNKIFISYSHKDWQKVKYIAEAYRAQGVDYFFDRHYLKAGDVYPVKIREYIDSADLFILCWSKNAAESDYVTLERHHALALAYPQVDLDKAKLTIHPISLEPRADYPDDMVQKYNFEEI